MRRRDFLRSTAAGSFLAALPPELLAQTSGRSSEVAKLGHPARTLPCGPRRSKATSGIHGRRSQ
jgi:hypothetical protein